VDRTAKSDGPSNLDGPEDPEDEQELRRRERLHEGRAGENEVPVSVAFDAVLARTDDLAVFVSGLRVFSNGVELTVEVRARTTPADDRYGLSEALHGHRDAQLLLGVEFADGRRCSTIDWDLMSGPPGTPRLWPGGGSGGQRSADASYFLSPLPPPGELRLVCAWPEAGIEDTVTPLPTQQILDAAARVVELWPWEPEIHEESYEPPAPRVPEHSWFAVQHREHPSAHW
jgi:hypothetical protein